MGNGMGQSHLFFFFSYMIVADRALYIIDWDNGVYEDRRSFCMYFCLPFLFIYFR